VQAAAVQVVRYETGLNTGVQADTPLQDSTPRAQNSIMHLAWQHQTVRSSVLRAASGTAQQAAAAAGSCWCIPRQRSSCYAASCKC
jgi:hypothetical protein